MAGRPPKRKYYSLKVGESMKATGRLSDFVHQYVHCFNRSRQRKIDGMKLEAIKDDDGVFIKRIT